MLQKVLADRYHSYSLNLRAVVSFTKMLADADMFDPLPSVTKLSDILPKKT